MRYGLNKRTMGNLRAANSSQSSPNRWTGPTVERQPGGSQWYLVGASNRRPLERPSGSISAVPNLPSSLPGMGPIRSHEEDSPGVGPGSGGTRWPRSFGSLHRRFLHGSQKRGLCVGKTKRGKGSKIMAIADGNGLPLAACVASASPHEVTLVEKTLDEIFSPKEPERLIGDKAYDSDPLALRLDLRRDIELIAPHRTRRKHPTQDGRPLRRYKRRWKVERLFAWLHNFRRLVVRYEYYPENFQGMVHLGCILILLRHL